MSTAPTAPRTGLPAHRASQRWSIPPIVGGLREILGARLVASLGGVEETRAVREWIDGTRGPGPGAVEQRLSNAYYIAALYSSVIGDAPDAGDDDLDAALLENGAGRAVTQAVSTHLCPQEGVDGIQPGSRHGDELNLWCLYAQSHDSRISSHLLRPNESDPTPDTPQPEQALDMPGLHWASTPWFRLHHGSGQGTAGAARVR